MKKGAKSRAASIGIDVGRHKTLLGLFDSRFDRVAEEKWRTHDDTSRIGFERRLKKSLKVLLREAKERDSNVKVVGVGVAGLADMKRGKVRSAPNLRFLDGYDFRTKVREHHRCAGLRLQRRARRPFMGNSASATRAARVMRSASSWGPASAAR
jgi:predicted NBD/HSP70 family sugar kinase